MKNISEWASEKFKLPKRSQPERIIPCKHTIELTKHDETHTIVEQAAVANPTRRRFAKLFSDYNLNTFVHHRPPVRVGYARTLEIKRILKKAVAISSAGIAALIACGGFMLSGGCSTTYSRAEFHEVVATTNRDTLGSVFYKGRKDGYDYFKARWNVGSKNMRVVISESPITKTFDYTTDEKVWRDATFMHLEGLELEQAVPLKLNAEQNAGDRHPSL